MSAMEKSGIQKLVFKNENCELRLERFSKIGATELDKSSEFEEQSAQPKIPILSKANAPLPRTSDMTQAMHPQQEPKHETPPGIYITSPMVGTFYNSPSPE